MSQKIITGIDYVLKRAVSEVIVESELRDRLRSGNKLRLKEGFDPSSPDIHLGHMVCLRKLRQFQEMGHQIVLIVGDWTAQIGDPTGVSVTRPILTREQVLVNAQTYMEQFFRIVDKSRTEVRWQSEWFGKFTLADVIKLTSKFTIAQLLARDDFSKRFKEERPISLTEFLYPLLQAYDSVAINADVEFGGNDQKFNLLVGRELQTMLGQPPQQIFTVPLLVGTDGTHKMSKSLGNFIGVAEPPETIYGKVMSITDNYILQYFDLLTDVPDEELHEYEKQLRDNAINPMILKKRLAKEIVTQLYDEISARSAEDNFEKVHQRRELPAEIPELHLPLPVSSQQMDLRAIEISQRLIDKGLVASRSEFIRLINQGAVKIDGEKITNPVILAKNCVLSIGKLRNVKLIFDT
jgi:tyrosyl-tRNA synthetase